MEAICPASPGVVIIAGPTASGKSSLALALAESLGGEVINADSMQVYRELRILTARPDAADEARAPHRLYGMLPASQVCSAGRWLKLAAAAIAQAHVAGRVPVVTGGTGLYLRALLQGLPFIPEVPPEIRNLARERHARLGGEAFHRELADLDPLAAARLPASDSQRLIRAFEVALATGRSLSAWQADPPQPLVTGPFLTLLLSPPRPALHAAIERRFHRMVAEGGRDEAKAFQELHLDPSLPATRAVGVRELARHLQGEISLEQAIQDGCTATRRLAKRQVTWFRHQIRFDRVIESPDDPGAREEIPTLVRRALTSRLPAP